MESLDFCHSFTRLSSALNFLAASLLLLLSTQEHHIITPLDAFLPALTDDLFHLSTSSSIGIECGSGQIIGVAFVRRWRLFFHTVHRCDVYSRVVFIEGGAYLRAPFI